MVKEETNRIQQEENQGVNYRKPIIIGSGILVAYFLLFGYKALALWFRSEIHRMIFGLHIPDFMNIVEVVLSTICLILGCFGLSFFISGLRKMRKLKEKKENKNLLVFIILYSIIMIAANLLFLFEIIIYILVLSIDIPESIGWYIIGTNLFSSMVVFGFVIIIIIIQNYFLKKSKIIDVMIVKRSVVHFFLLGSLIIWIFFLQNNYTVVVYIPEYFHIPFFSSQILASFLAAGVYLELALKLKKQAKN